MKTFKLTIFNTNFSSTVAAPNNRTPIEIRHIDADFFRFDGSSAQFFTGLQSMECPTLVAAFQNVQECVHIADRQAELRQAQYELYLKQNHIDRLKRTILMLRKKLKAHALPIKKNSVKLMK